MLQDRPFEFNNNALIRKSLIENEIVLHFFALKTFIQIANSLDTIKLENHDQNDVIKFFKELYVLIINSKLI